MPPKKKSTSPAAPTPIDAHKHAAKRANIPTEELRNFVQEAEKNPTRLLYPRDPSLDPQLVWKGKDEQDSQDLEIPVYPIYIQEKIQPQAIIENVRAQVRKAAPTAQLSLFADFDGLPEFDDRVDFYHHPQNWSNRMILGDSLRVMASLAEKEGLKGQVQMIYLDPPYGIKFGSNWQVSTRKRDVKDGRAEDATRQPEQVKAFRDTWQLGIHSYLAYLRDRLVVARELLTESGSIFVQIGDENVHLVRCVLDEIFGSEGFVSLISVKKTATPSALLDSGVFYILWYSKSENVKYHNLYLDKPCDEWARDTPGGSWGAIIEGIARPLTPTEKQNTNLLPNGASVYCLSKLTSAGPASQEVAFIFEGKAYYPGGGSHWKTTPQGMQRLIKAGRIEKRDRPWFMRFYIDAPFKRQTNIFEDTSGKSDESVYVVQTQTDVIRRCILMTTDPGDLVLYPTCGSGTTAFVAEHWGRRWITIDTSRVAIALARTRLMSARLPYYLLADSPEGSQKEAELSGNFAPASAFAYDLQKGFVYRRVPHVTLKSIANNEEIDTIHASYQPQLDPLLAQLNALLAQSWQEWGVPRLPSTYQSEKERADTEKALRAIGVQPASQAWKLLEAYWQLRRARQAAIDASIARRADTELLFDQPFDDSRRIRVTGPFTVESLSPHRVLSPADADQPCSETDAQVAAASSTSFLDMVLANLRRAGIQNTVKNERLKFDRLEPYPGIWLQAAGEYTEKDGVSRRVALTLGPEHGTVGPDQVKEAAKEALKGVGFDLLVVCGFAFDPHVSEEAKQYNQLTVLPTRMNPDLAMSDELLKKTGAGNLFMVFGEPDLTLEQKDGQITVHLNGLDIYDPTTGQIRSNSTDDIACWFIDTDYDEESFFVRHAYFTGADQPYEKLQRALRAEVDEAAWSRLYSATSYPFPRPARGRIAVKVINHYGDEALKVYEIK